MDRKPSLLEQALYGYVIGQAICMTAIIVAFVIVWLVVL